MAQILESAVSPSINSHGQLFLICQVSAAPSMANTWDHESHVKITSDARLVGCG